MTAAKSTRTVSSEVARQEETKAPTIAQVVNDMGPELQRALPRHMNGDRMARLALTVLRKTPALAKCTPASLAGALLTAAALGLEPGVSGEAYLVPYNNECTLIIGYQGLAKLFFQHPAAQTLDAQAVHQNDHFDYAHGLQPYLVHKPARTDRGPITHYYAAATLSTGGSAFVVLTPDEVKELRGKVGPNGGIADPMHWMERKTAIRQLVKILPKSSEFVVAINSDERLGSELYVERLAENQPAAIGAAPDGVNTETGEVTEENGPTEEELARINAEANADAQNGGSK